MVRVWVQSALATRSIDRKMEGPSPAFVHSQNAGRSRNTNVSEEGVWAEGVAIDLWTDEDLALQDVRLCRGTSVRRMIVS